VSILDKIRRLLKGAEIPEDVARIYRMSKSESEALDNLEGERSRSDRHREVLIGDIRALTGEEERLLEEGRGEDSPVRRRIVAKKVAEIRSKIGNVMNRVDLLTRRVAIFDTQIALLRDRAVLAAPLPERAEIEQAAEDALVAREEFEERAGLSDLLGGVSRIEGTSESERRAIKELEGGEEVELSFDEMLAEEEGRIGPEKRADQGRKPLEEGA
jgi:hypothetical protein